MNVKGKKQISISLNYSHHYSSPSESRSNYLLAVFLPYLNHQIHSWLPHNVCLLYTEDTTCFFLLWLTLAKKLRFTFQNDNQITKEQSHKCKKGIYLIRELRKGNTHRGPPPPGSTIGTGVSPWMLNLPDVLVKNPQLSSRFHSTLRNPF